MNSSSKVISPSKSPRDTIEFFEPRPVMPINSETNKKYTDDEKVAAAALFELHKTCTKEDKAVADD